MKKLLFILLLVPLLIIGCKGTNTEPTTTSTYEFRGGTTTPTPRSLRITAVTDKALYFLGDIIKIKINVANNIDEPVTINGFPPKTDILRYADLVWTFGQGGENVTLGVGESKTYDITWDPNDPQGQFIRPAPYQIYIWFPPITIGLEPGYYGEGYSEFEPIVITFPQGAMNKTIIVNQSQTVGDITFNLNRVEFSDTEMKVFTMKTPLPPAKDPHEPPFWRGRADFTVNYKVDDGVTFETTGAGINVVENGVEYIWENLSPAPSDAKTLTFIIAKMSIPGEGDYGPFRFEIPLNVD